ISRDGFKENEFGVFRFRNYSPRIGRFLTEDALAPYHYAYAANNPLSFTDPLGLLEFAEYNVAVALAKKSVGCDLALIQSIGRYVQQHVHLPASTPYLDNLKYAGYGIKFIGTDLVGAIGGAIQSILWARFATEGVGDAGGG